MVLTDDADRPMIIIVCFCSRAVIIRFTSALSARRRKILGRFAKNGVNPLVLVDSHTVQQPGYRHGKENQESREFF